jgi:hypothetical protein
MRFWSIVRSCSHEMVSQNFRMSASIIQLMPSLRHLWAAA